MTKEYMCSSARWITLAFVITSTHVKCVQFQRHGIAFPCCLPCHMALESHIITARCTVGRSTGAKAICTVDQSGNYAVCPLTTLEDGQEMHVHGVIVHCMHGSAHVCMMETRYINFVKSFALGQNFGNLIIKTWEKVQAQRFYKNMLSKYWLK